MSRVFDWFKKIFGTKKENKFPGIVVGKILEINKHPNADRLRLVKVDVGPASTRGNDRSSTRGGNKELEVVCGAPNIQVGQKVPVALVGTKLSNGIEIKEAEIRGIKSCGMLCAEDELELGKNHSGIMILDEKAEIGMEFSEYINLNK